VTEDNVNAAEIANAFSGDEDDAPIQAKPKRTRPKPVIAEKVDREPIDEPEVKAAKAKRKVIGQAKTAPVPYVGKEMRAARAKKPAKAVKEAATADKRLGGALKVHGASDKEVKAAVAARRSKSKTPVKVLVAAKVPVKKAKPVAKAKKTEARQPKIEVSLSRSRQRKGGVGAGAVRGADGGLRQVTMTITLKQHKKLARFAKDNAVSLSEAVRQSIDKAVLA
jgi:hypothetical protein